MNKEKKLKIQIIVTIVIAVLMVGGMVGAWAMVLVRPLTEEMAKTKTELDAAKGEAKKLTGAVTALEFARVKEKRLNVQLAFFRNRYRSFDFGKWDPAKPDPTSQLQLALWHKWMQEFSYDFGPRLWGEIHGAAEASDVTLTKLDDIKTDAPPKGPEDIFIPSNGFFKPTGAAPLTVSVTGTLENIMKFMRRIHEGQILMKVAGGIKLEGSWPNVSTSFTVQPYLVAKGDNVQLTAAGAAVAVPAVSGTTVKAIADAATTPMGGSAPKSP